MSRGRQKHADEPGRPKGVVLDRASLQARRAELGLTQRELAEQAGLTRRTVRAAEQGRRVAFDSARRLATALRLAYPELVHPAPRVLRSALEAAGLAPLPPPALWVSREEEARRLVAALQEPEERVIACISGPPGIGKTALARFVAAELAAAYPDGIVWVKAPSQGTARTLDVLQKQISEALGIYLPLPDRVVVGREAAHRAFRTQLFGRRRLLVLDDVPSADPVHPFVGREGPARVLVTTPHRSVAPALGASPCLELGPLSGHAARELLAAHIGSERLAADTRGTHRLLSRLGHTPGSVQVAGAVLAREPFTRLDDYAERVDALPAELRGHAERPE